MWYRIDITKLVMQLLPPILRSKLLVALANVPEVRLSLAVELPEVRGLIARTIQMTLLSAFGNK